MQYLLKLLIFVNIQQLEFPANTSSKVLLEGATDRKASAHPSSPGTTVTYQRELHIILEIRSRFVVLDTERTFKDERPIRAFGTGATTEILTNGDFVPADIHGQRRSAVCYDIPTRDPRLSSTSI